MSGFQWVLLILAAILVCWMVGAYNRLLRLRNRISHGVDHIHDPLHRRDELIAGLLTLLRPLGQHVDSHAMLAVDEASSAVMAAAEVLLEKPCDPAAPRALAIAEVGLQAALSHVLEQVQQVPELRLFPGMLERLAGISEAERRLRFGRQLYNDAVRVYNAALMQWPTRWLRTSFGWDCAATI